ncbi:MAG: hypothetical protein IPK14_19030 [Blastocatellia bacterium]|nr:hypothetical protein [Blastocatellia bacterium]MBL8195062.1 hypothetical protein [Blastocatellia bacterium]MBN8724896.1 hypothetical protein [Acidobacteriota bacterium]
MALRRAKKKIKSQKELENIVNNTNNDSEGVIKVDTGMLKLPIQLMEEESDESRPFWQIEPAILVIFILAIVFISFITVLISQMPVPSK